MSSSVTQRLTIYDIQGVFGIMPTPATPGADSPGGTDTVDHDETRRAARQLVADGVDALMINGTFGEAATLTRSEWESFTETVVATVDGDVPVLAGPTTLNTRETIERARFARDAGADGVLLGRPMWCELSFDATIQFYRDVADAVPELGIVVYHNPSAFKNRFTPKYWEALADIQQVVGAKYGTIDDAYGECVQAAAGEMCLMPIEMDWYEAHEMFPDESVACWSGSVSCGPGPVIALRRAIQRGDGERARELSEAITATYEPFFPDDRRDFRRHTIPLEKTRIDAAGYMSPGPVRPPYHVTPEAFLAGAREAGTLWADLVEAVDHE